MNIVPTMGLGFPAMPPARLGMQVLPTKPILRVIIS